MQIDNALVKSLNASFSPARMSRYVKIGTAQGKHPLDLYCHNVEISKSLGWTLSIWEICIRNKVSAFLKWKYSLDWAYDVRLQAQLSSQDKERLKEARERQERERGITRAGADPIIADLSVGFWVNLLQSRYEIPFAWRPTGNLPRVFPVKRALTLSDVSERCNRLRDLRNRVAHHEPILHLPIAALKADALFLLDGMCAASASLARARCTVDVVLAAGPGAHFQDGDV